MKQPTKDTLKFAIKMRCLLEGCRYGDTLIFKSPTNFCIYCGKPRQFPDNWTGVYSTKFKKKTIPCYICESSPCVCEEEETK